MLFRLRNKTVILLTLFIGLVLFLPNGRLYYTQFSPKTINNLFNIQNIDPSTNCQHFFDEFLKKNRTLTPSDFVFDPLPWGKYLEDKISSELKNKPDQVTNEMLRAWHDEYEEGTLNHFTMVESLKSQMIATRLYNKCIIQNSHIDAKAVPQIETLLFPWRRHDFSIRNAIRNSKGKGIVISAATVHYDNLVSLILTLRLIGNNLPVEVLHKSEMTLERQRKLEKLATIPINNDTLVFKEIFEHESYGTLSPNLIDKSFKPFDLKFIDIKPLLEPSYRGEFTRFSVKILALLFSSFEEVMVMDVDTVPFKSPQSFFDIDEYKKHGAFLFRDRELIDRSSLIDLTYWSELLPTLKELEYFSEKQNLIKFMDYRDNIRYLKGFTHFVESGIVLLNKRKHAGSVLISTQLQLWTSATKRVWGDKEFFWLSMLIDGDEDFAVNDTPAGAFGKSNIEGDPEENMACSVQPVHTYKDSLYWINSGFYVCKKASGRIAKQGGNPRKKNKDPIDIERIIIPPNLDDYYLHSDYKDENFVSGWVNMKECNSFEYCASLTVQVHGEQRIGKSIEIPETDRTDYGFLGAVWVAAGQIIRRIDDLNS